MKKKILFLINGEGLGNSTRCYAIIQSLLKHDVELYSVLSKNSSWFFSKNNCFKKIYNINQISYSFDKSGKLNSLKSLGKIFFSTNIFIKNIISIKKIVKKIKPNCIVTDSQYVFSFLKKFDIPIIAINNSSITLNDYKHTNKIPKQIKTHLYFIEFLDNYYHSCYPDLTLSCGITKKEDFNVKNTIQISPITRNNLKISEKKSKKCLIMLSGGMKIKKKIDLSFIEEELIFINAPTNLFLKKNFLKIYPKIKDNIGLLNQVDFSIINSGYSAITESIFFNKPVLTIPIENHSEQWFNSKKIVNENLGDMTTIDDLKKSYFKFKKNINKYYENTSKLKNKSTGADEAAEIILKF